MAIWVPVSWGELLDKITILELKARRISAAHQLDNVRRELDALAAVRDGGRLVPEAAPLIAELERVNGELWDVEDEIRACDARGDFGDRFIALARRVYVTNDRRAALKRSLNEMLGSELCEEKSYAASSISSGR